MVGWKAGLPGPDKWVLAPIAHLQQGELCLFEQQSEQYSIEPELAFLLATDLPARAEPYSEAEVKAAIGATHLALELIIRPYKADAGAEFLDQLAAGLFNQGLYIGPEITSDSIPHQFELVLDYAGQQQQLAIARGGFRSAAFEVIALDHAGQQFGDVAPDQDLLVGQAEFVERAHLGFVSWR